MSKAEKTKQYIIEKTAPLFNRKGYAGTSMSDITEATGLTKGSIYGNFENKDAVALAAFDFNLQKVNSIFRASIAAEESYTGKLLAFAKVYDSFLHPPFPDGGCPVLNTATEADDTHPQLKEAVSKAVDSWRKLVTGIIKKGMEQGEFSPTVHPDNAAISIIALLEGGIMIAKLTGKLHYKKAISDAIRLLVAGMR